MKCPYCSGSFTGKKQYCPYCTQPLDRIEGVKRKPAPQKKKRRKLPPIPYASIGRVFAALVLVCALCVALYKIYYWASDYRITRLYTRGIYTPTQNAITLEDGRPGHSVVFYGKDGDQIFIPELNRSLTICGGVARLAVADADWFDPQNDTYETAEVTLTPMLISEKGERTILPPVEMTVDMPSSPLQIIKPEQDGQTVLTSRYTLEMDVVPGSTVFLNGEDISAKVTRSGELSQAVLVRPIGTNTYSVVVRTQGHRESRHDIEIYRQAYEINVELDDSIGDSSSNETMAITGMLEPGATLTVETPHIDESVEVDSETGRFGFIAKFSGFGNNIVRFRASAPNKSDAVMSLNIKYTPNLDTYAASAWKMDYAQLCDLYDQWTGKVFKVEGKVVTTYIDKGENIIVLDVSGDSSGQNVLLVNESSVKSINTGGIYTGYADVAGRAMYNAVYCPKLIVRYFSLKN